MIETDIEQSSTLLLAMELISRKSVTPNDDGCQSYIAKRLEQSGFVCEHFKFEDVDNLYARIGTKSPLLVLSGHTDVVPAGPNTDWLSPPFEPEIRDGKLFGRGACDMKAALAAMIVAAENFLAKTTEFDGSIAFLLTSDEEGPALHGTQKVIAALEKRQEKIDYCIVGEPSCDKIVGDQIRIGRRGSLSANVSFHGKQGHVAYPHLAKNAIHMCLPALQELTQTVWDKGDANFPPTTFQISNMNAGTGAGNVIPGHAQVAFNFRFSPAIQIDEIKQKVDDILNQSQLNCDIEWTLGASPFLTKKGKLTEVVEHAILDVANLKTKYSTAGGTSDARFIAPTGAEVIELGVPNTTAHQTNESVKIIDLEVLTQCYEKILSKLFN